MVFCIRRAFSALGRAFGVTLLSVVTIGLALAVLVTFAVVVESLEHAARDLGREVAMSAYLVREGSIEREGARVVEQVATWPEVASVQLRTSAEAMEEFKTSLGRDAILLEGLPAGVLPASVEIALRTRPWAPEEVQRIAKKVGELSGIQDVRYGQEDIERINALRGFARVAVLVLGAALCLATVFIVSNTIRLAVYARRDEIEIMSLVGATSAFVRAPFLLEGVIHGVLGGVGALLGLVLLREVLILGIERGFGYAYGPIDIGPLLPPRHVGAVLATGAGLGFFGSVLAVRKFLKA